jgi:hypothetical protein
MEPAAARALEHLKVAKAHTAPLEPQAKEAEIMETQRVSGASYQTLKAFIDGKDPQKQHYGLVKATGCECGGCVDWVAEQNLEAWKRGCETRGHQVVGQGAGAGQPPSSPAAPPSPPSVLCSQMVVKRKNKGRRLSMGFIGDSWPKAECTYDADTRKFTCTYKSGDQQLEDCWLVDVKDRPNKKKHRFDIANDNASEETVELAATSGEVKLKWVAAMETKEQRASREEAEVAEEEAVTGAAGEVLRKTQEANYKKLLSMAYADGEVDAEEERSLAAAREEYGFTMEQHAEILATVDTSSGVAAKKAKENAAATAAIAAAEKTEEEAAAAAAAKAALLQTQQEMGVMQAQLQKMKTQKKADDWKARKMQEEEEARKEQEKARMEQEEQARKEQEEQARKEAEEKARKEQEEHTRKEQAEKARKEQAEKARKEQEEKARKEQEEKVRKEQEEQVRKEQEEQVRKEQEEQVRKEAEEKVRKEAEETARTKRGVAARIGAMAVGATLGVAAAASGSEDKSYKFGDFTRGLLAPSSGAAMQQLVITTFQAGPLGLKLVKDKVSGCILVEAASGQAAAQGLQVGDKLVKVEEEFLAMGLDQHMAAQRIVSYPRPVKLTFQKQ